MRNILHEISQRKANWIGNILRWNYLLWQVIDGKIKGRIEVTERRGIRRRKLLDYLNERTGYLHLKEEALDHTMRRACFGRGFGAVARQTAVRINGRKRLGRPWNRLLYEAEIVLWRPNWWRTMMMVMMILILMMKICVLIFCTFAVNVRL
jgi:hypothetical protein